MQVQAIERRPDPAALRSRPRAGRRKIADDLSAAVPANGLARHGRDAGCVARILNSVDLRRSGDPGMTRTSDLRFRKPPLCPAELRDRLDIAREFQQVASIFRRFASRRALLSGKQATNSSHVPPSQWRAGSRPDPEARALECFRAPQLDRGVDTRPVARKRVGIKPEPERIQVALLRMASGTWLSSTSWQFP